MRVACGLAEEPVSTQAEEPAEAFPELGRYGIVQDWIDGRVDVEHDTTKIEEVVEYLQAHMRLDGTWRRDNPQDEDSIWQEAKEKAEHHGHEHEDHLPPCPHLGLLRGRAAERTPVKHQLLRDARVDKDQDEERQHEQECYDGEDVQLAPEQTIRRAARKHVRAVVVFHGPVLRHGQHGTGHQKRHHPDGADDGQGTHLGARVSRLERLADGVVPLEADRQYSEYGYVGYSKLQKWDQSTCRRRKKHH